MHGPSQHNGGLAEGPPRFMAIFRTAQGTVLVGSCTRGMSRSLDNGETWVPVDGWDHVSHNCFVHDAQAAVLVATSAGLARSSDDGMTWSPLDDRPGYATLDDGFDGPEGRTVYRLLRLADGRVLAATDGDGVWIGDNGDWRPTGLDGAIVHALAVTGTGTWLAGTRGRGIWRSHDEGQNWQVAASGLPDSDVHCLAIDEDGTVHAGTGNGIACSDDDGMTWVVGAEALAGNRIFAILSLGGGRILAGSYAQLWRYSDGAWRPTDPGLTPDEAWTVFWDGERVLAGAKIGVLESTDEGASWHPTGESSVVFDFARLRDGTLLAGGDLGVLRVDDWSRVGHLERRAFSIAGLDGDGLLAGTVAAGLHRYDGEWARVEAGFDHPNVYSLTWTSGGRLLASTGTVLDGRKSGGIFASDDDGATWRQVWVGQSVYQVVETSDGTLFAGAQRCRILRSTDGGRSWTDCPPATRHEAKIYSLTVDRNDWLYLGAGGELLRSRDAAVTWELLADGLDGVSVYAMDEGDGGVLAAATNTGMYTSRDRGETWHAGALRLADGASDPASE